jgi:hypothetical protein
VSEEDPLTGPTNFKDPNIFNINICSVPRIIKPSYIVVKYTNMHGHNTDKQQQPCKTLKPDTPD